MSGGACLSQRRMSQSLCVPLGREFRHVACGSAQLRLRAWCGIKCVSDFRELQLTLFCKLPTALGIIQGMAGFRNHFSSPALILPEGVTGMRM